VSSRNLPTIVREAREAAAELQRATQDLEASLGALEAAIATTIPGMWGRVSCGVHRTLAFRPQTDKRFRLVVETDRAPRRATLLVETRGDLLRRGIAAIPALLDALAEQAREQARDVGAGAADVQILQKNLDAKTSAPK